MRIELTSEELQVFSIAFKAQPPFEVEDVFDGKPLEYIQPRVNDICEKYIKAGILGSPEFETLMLRFLFPQKIMSVFSKNTYWMCIMSSQIGLCARYYNGQTGKYLLWTINSNEEANATILKMIRLGDVKASQKQKACFTGDEFAAEVRDNFHGMDNIASRAYSACINNDLMLVNENNEKGYPLIVTTQFNTSVDGIWYLKAQIEDDRNFVEAGLTDTDGLINTALYELRMK